MSIYTEDYARQGYLLALEGITEARMCELWQVPQSTLSGWKIRHPEFRQALQDGGVLANVKVAEHFFLNCIDRWVDAEEIHVYKGDVIRVPVRKFIQGDKWAQARWLAIKDPERWSETQRIQISQTNVNVTKLDLSTLTKDELMLYKKIHQSQLAEHIDMENSGN